MDLNNMDRDFNAYYDGVNREEAVKKTMLGVYGWMCLALLITAFTGVVIASNVNLLVTVARAYIGFAIAEVAVVFFLSFRAHKMSTGAARFWFIVYSILNGATLSGIFIVYELGTVTNAFFVTAGVFGVMTLYGAITKTDLSRIGNLFVMGLYGLIIATIVGFFMHSPAYDMALMYVGVFIFVGLTGYDTQKIKQMAYAQAGSEQGIANASILGALILYLDFINIFIRLVRIMGNRD